MVLAISTNHRSWELLPHNLTSEAQQLVSLHITVLVIVGLHTVQIGVDQVWLLIDLEEILDLLVVEFVEIIAIGQASDFILIEEVGLHGIELVLGHEAYAANGVGDVHIIEESDD